MLEAIYAKIDALQPDYRDAVQKTKARLRKQVHQMTYDERKSLESINTFVTKELSDFVNGSIR